MAEEEQLERENYLRHVILVVDHAKEALTSLIDKDLKEKNLTFDKFLDREKHDIYHRCYNGKCCKCLGQGPSFTQRRSLTVVQFELLYAKTNQLPCSNPGKTIIACICCISVNPKISLDLIDVTLSKYLLVNYCTDIFWKDCLKGLSLENFLNNEKHFIYHLCHLNTSCCTCPFSFDLPKKKVIDETQLKTLFLVCPKLSNCRKRTHNAAPNCICGMVAQSGVLQSNLSPGLQQKLLEHSVKARKSVEVLVEIRNSSVAHISKARIPDSHYKDIKLKTETALLDIGQFCGNLPQVKTALEDAGTRPLDYTKTVQYNTTLLEIIKVSLNIKLKDININKIPLLEE